LRNTNKPISYAIRTLVVCGLFSTAGFGQTPGTITTIAGTGTPGYNGDNQTATNAQINVPPMVAVDSQGNIYIADQYNNRIRKVSTAGQITTIAGTGTAGFSGDGGLATAATLNTPTGVFADTLGNIYINDTTNQRIRKINAAGIISTVAGNGTGAFSGDSGPATSASLFNAGRVVADGSGNLYIADQSNHRIRKVDTTGTITTIAGTGVAGYNGDGAAAATQLNNPTAVALDGSGNVYFSDQFNHRIREITGGQVKTIAGSGVAGYNGDGAALSTQLNYPGGLMVDPTSGAIYFVDCTNYRVRKISVDRTQITTVAGNGTAGYNGDNIPALTSEFSSLVFGIAIDSNGNIYIADASSDRIRKISSFNALTFIGSMPHLAAEGGWNTTFTFVNKGTTSAAAQNNMFDPSGVALTLPITEPQSNTTLTGSSVSQTLAPNASFVMQVNGPANVPYVVGSAQLSAGGNIDGFAVFHFDPTQQEAVVPLETRNASSYLLPFDNTSAVVTGVAVANVSSASAMIPVIIRDDTGTQLQSTFLSLAANGHASYVLSDEYQLTANIRGTIEFDTPSGAQISVLGIRYTPPGTTTTIPSLANIGTGGGLIAHLAIQNGWQTSFVLVNNGDTAASATLNFYADGGSPMTLPLTYLQTGATASASSVTQSIPARASLWLQASGAVGAAVLTGSAQLTTTGNVGGYVVFRYNPNGQEAVVPIETRNSNGYIVAFDNTSNIATGIAISVASPFAQSIPVVVRDDQGNLINTGSGFVILNSNGHSSFVMTNNFPSTAGLRGTIEFDKPTGTEISVIGIRSPPALTFTSLPPLAK
jgi:sugar lactone lactonase YvrE